MKSKLYIFVLKAVLVIPLFLFGLWQLQMLYAPDIEAHKSVEALQPVEEEGIFRKIQKSDKRKPGPHFHMVDEVVSQPEPFQPVCLSCHGTFPHSKNNMKTSIFLRFLILTKIDGW